MMLLYDNNQDNVENIARFSRSGELLEAVPASRLKTGVDPTEKSWFRAALEQDGEPSFFGSPRPAGL